MKNYLVVHKNSINKFARKDWQWDIEESIIKQYSNHCTFRFAMDIVTHNYTDILLHVCRYVHRPLHFKVLFQEFLRLLIQLINLKILSVLIYMASKSKITLSKHANVQAMTVLIMHLG